MDGKAELQKYILFNPCVYQLQPWHIYLLKTANCIGDVIALTSEFVCMSTDLKLILTLKLKHIT